MVKIRHLGRVLLGLATLFVVSSVPASAGIGDAIDRSTWTITASSTQGGDNPGTTSSTINNANDCGGPAAIIDGDNSTYWHSNWSSNPMGSSANPEWFVVDRGESELSTAEAAVGIGGISYTPRQGSSVGNGTATSVLIYIGDDFSDILAVTPGTSSNNARATISALGTTDSRYVTSATWTASTAVKTLAFDKEYKGRYILFVIADSSTDSYYKYKFGSCAEFNAYTYANTADVTYNYYIGSVADDNKYGASSEGTVILGSAVTAPTAPTYTTVDSYTITQGSNTLGTTDAVSSTDDITVNVILNEDLPFEVSTDDATYYYIFGIHSTDNASFPNGEDSWVIKYNGTSLSKEVMDYAQNISTLDDSYLWYIKGSLLNGFKLYSKNSGESFLRKPTTGNTACSFGSDETYCNFKLYASDAVSGEYCFKLDDDTYYINKNGDGILQGWTDRDGGSSIHFRPISYLPEVYYTEVITTCNDDIYNAPEGAIGLRTTSSIDYSAATTAYDASVKAPFDDTTTAALVAANTTAKAAIDAIEYDEVRDDLTGYYRIISAYPGFNNEKGLYTDSKFMWGTVTKSMVNAIYKIEKNESDGASGRPYVLLSLNENKYLNGVYGALSSEGTPSDQGHISIANLGGGQFTITCGNGMLHTEGWSGGVGGSLTNWTAGVNTGSAWYFVPATELEVALNTVGEASYATTYLPFAVSGVTSAKAYTGTLDKEAKTLTATEISAFPAKTGVILKSDESAETATLAIAESADAISGTNDITGTLASIAITDDNRANYLVFGRKNVSEGETAVTEPGFYQYTGTTIPANKAYLDNSTSSEAIRLVFGGETTGIDAATIFGGESNAPVYDLSGRRVATPVKGGIYLQGGKKFIK